MLVFIKESEGVFYAVRTVSLDIIQISEGFKDAFSYFRSVDIEWIWARLWNDTDLRTEFLGLWYARAVR